MSEETTIPDEDKVKMCISCAGAIMKIRPHSGLSYHDLENIGFLSMKSSIINKAYSEAYYSMLNKASRPRFDRNNPRNRSQFLYTRRGMSRCGEFYEPKLDSLIDIKNAIMALPSVDRDIAVLYLLQGCTQKELCELLHLSQPTVSIKIQGIRDRLCILLKDYDEKQTTNS